MTASILRVNAGELAIVGDLLSPASSRGKAIMLHGGGQTRNSWRSTAQALFNAGWTVVSVDARGHGESGWAVHGDYSLDALVSDLAAVMAETVQGDEPVVLVGASMGGLTGIAGLGEGKLTASGLVLVDIALRVEPAGSARVAEFMRASPRGYASLEEVAQAIASYKNDDRPSGDIQRLRRNVRLGADGRWRWHWDPAFMTPDGDESEANSLNDEARIRQAAARIKCPVLLLRGEHSDVVSEAGARELVEVVPNARCVEVSGAGHMVSGLSNDPFTREILTFMSGLINQSATSSRFG